MARTRRADAAKPRRRREAGRRGARTIPAARRLPRPTRTAAGATRALAEWVASPHAFPESTIGMARRCLLDWVGAAVAGTAMPPARIAAELARQIGGPPESTLIAGGRVGANAAALANGVASHAVEMDDLHRPSVMHLAVVTIPAALALAERDHVPGRRLLDAIVCGYEVGARVGEGLGRRHYQIWHTTATAGTLGAAAAGAVVLGLSPDETLHALGTAGTLCAGLWEFLADGAMSKTLHAGRAAETGVLSARLAREGFTGASAVLEGEKGLLRAMAAGGDPTRLLDGLGGPVRIDDNSFKLHAACGHTHPAVDAALELRRRGVRSADITAIRVGTFRTALDVTSIRDPQNPYQAKFSLPFCVALALARGRVALGEFSEATLADPELRALAGRVTLAEEAASNRAFPGRWQASVAVTVRGGRREVVRVDAPRGTRENPASDAELREKFDALCDGRIPAALRDALADAVGTIDGAQDVAAIAWGADADRSH